MTYQKLSKRQLIAMTWWNRPSFQQFDGIICDGSVRSGKTISMSVGFVLWAMARFNGATFGICGKTIESLRRNVIVQLPTWLEGIVAIRERRSENKLVVTVSGRTNYFYLFGGRDESSYTLIQGITLAGVLFDEVALMPRSFVEQALARCSVAGSTFWFNCNPEGPEHWFYKEWVLKHREKNVLHLHFTMADNLSLSEDTKQRYERLYSGVFYDRYIRGLWVVAEGVIYRQFADHPDRYITNTVPNIRHAVIGVDFGGNGSAHAFCCLGYDTDMHTIYVLDEYYRKEIITPTQLDNDFCAFCARCLSKYSIYAAYCDSAETTLIQGLRGAAARAGMSIDIHGAAKRPVNDRIRFLSRMMSLDRFKVLSYCEHTISALRTAVWDSKAIVEDVRLDNGTTNIDSLDALEYAYERDMSLLIAR